MSYGMWRAQIMLPRYFLTLEKTMFQTKISNEAMPRPQLFPHIKSCADKDEIPQLQSYFVPKSSLKRQNSATSSVTKQPDHRQHLDSTMYANISTLTGSKVRTDHIQGVFIFTNEANALVVFSDCGDCDGVALHCTVHYL